MSNTDDEVSSGVGGYESDTGFSSEGSGDDVVEDLEKRGQKRGRAEREAESDVADDDDDDGEKFKKKKSQHRGLHKPPTAEELSHLKETQNLFHSNLFRLQIEEMLKEVQVKEKKKIEFDAWYEKFCSAVLKVQDSENKYEISDQNWLKQYKIKIPISQVPSQVNGTFQFRKPSQISLIGSYPTSVLVGPNIAVDVLIEMPQSFFQREDFLNSRYHRKRALYMCHLAHHLQTFSNLIQNINFVSEEVDCLKPRLEVTPAGKLSKTFSLVLHFCPQKGTFKLNRFSPSKSNVRKRWLFRTDDGDDDDQDMVPTPFYNSSVIADLTVEENMQYLKNMLLMHSNIKDGITLLKIWLRQRELDNSIGGFNGFMLSLLVCYLIQIKKINILMSSYQVFRNVCHFLSTSNWVTNGVTLCSSADDTNIPTLTEFHTHHKVVFVDVTGYHNLCYAMSPVTFKQVQDEAQFAINCLNNPNINSFQSLFIVKVPFYQHFDHVVMFTNGDSLEALVDVHASKDQKLSHCTVTSNLARDLIVDLLIRGFGTRVARICVKQPGRTRWKVEKKYKKSTSLTIGFNLDPNNYFSVLDKAQESETETFREFWGDKSELRRFQDGTITEAVVWSGRTLAEKRLICKEILTYLTEIKFGLKPDDYQYLANQLDGYVFKDVEEASLKVVDAYDQLVKQLRDLADLPLDVVSVQGTSPVFRYTDAFPPVPQRQRGHSSKQGASKHSVVLESLKSCPPWISPVNVTIKMAASSKWPQDLEGIKRIRAAFNIKISESLASQYGVVSEALQDRVELIKNGFVFRLRVVYPNEIPLLKKMVDTDGLVKYKDTEKSLALERESADLPKLTSALHGLYQEHNSFGPACCLVKRWIAAHLLDSSHISEECIELLVASLYVRPQPHDPPCQPQVAFFRFHYMMVTTNWNTDCIVLNINDELTREDIMEIESRFSSNRSSLPPLFIVTPQDRHKSVFTMNSPSPLILLRLIELCANALKLIEGEIYSNALFDSRVLFRPCLDSYDALIRLNDAFNPRRRIQSERNAEFPGEFRQNIPINGFDPVSLYLKELRENYGDMALFFHDTYGGTVVGVLWKPTALETCEFKVPNLSGRVLKGKSKLLELNRDAILEDFCHVGEGLVDQIDVKTGDGQFKKLDLFNRNDKDK